MEVYKSTDYPIIFQPYTLRISIKNMSEHNRLNSIFMNAEIIAKALAYEGYDESDELVNFINQIGKELEINE